HIVRIDTPDFPKVLRDAVFLGRREITKSAAQEHQCPLELIVSEGSHVVGQLLPQGESSQKGIAISLRQTLKPARPEVSVNPGRQASRDFPREFFIGNYIAFDQKRAGIAG